MQHMQMQSLPTISVACILVNRGQWANGFSRDSILCLELLGH